MVIWANLQEQLSLLGHFSQAGQIHHFLLIKSPVFWPRVLCPKKESKEKLSWSPKLYPEVSLCLELSGCKEKKTHPNKLKGVHLGPTGTESFECMVECINGLRSSCLPYFHAPGQ